MEKRGCPRPACFARHIGALAALASPLPPSQAKGGSSWLTPSPVRHEEGTVHGEPPVPVLLERHTDLELKAVHEGMLMQV